MLVALIHVKHWLNESWGGGMTVKGKKYRVFNSCKGEKKTSNPNCQETGSCQTMQAHAAGGKISPIGGVNKLSRHAVHNYKPMYMIFCHGKMPLFIRHSFELIPWKGETSAKWKLIFDCYVFFKFVYVFPGWHSDR